MSDGTKISWSEATWNPVTGCTEVSPGCAHCYAKTFAERWRGVEGNYYEHGFDVQLRPSQLAKPLHWTRARRIFVNSMSDLFHEDIPDEYIDRVFAVMALCHQHTFQILTKRIERAEEYLTPLGGDSEDYRDRWDAARRWLIAASAPNRREYIGVIMAYQRWPLPNVIVGPTIENQHWLDVRGPYLRRLHALGWKTMVSYEPALGPVDFWPYLFEEHRMEEVYATAINWLICGGESGVKRRPFNHEWARKALADARLAGVPFFMKQDGAFHSEVYDSLPDDLKVRQFP